jgi:hypothetical protein
MQAIFSSAINHWVENYQSKTSAIAKAFIIGSAVEQFQHGSAFVGALSFTAAKGQGTQHPNITTSKVSIPASSFTFGGEMIVTAIPSTEGTTTIDIKGYTQGIMGGTLKENVNGLRDYLMEALPYLDIQYKQIQQSESQDQNRSGIGIADEIERLSNLHKIGALSETEYAQAKQKVLSQ